jgi:hypothetical protein
MIFLQELSDRALTMLYRDCKPDIAARTAGSLNDQVAYP